MKDENNIVKLMLIKLKKEIKYIVMLMLIKLKNENTNII